MKNKLLSFFSGLLSVIVPGVLFALFFIVLKNLPMAILAAVLSYTILYVLLTPKKKSLEISIDRIKEKELKRIIKEGLENVRALEKTGDMIKENRVKKKITEILVVTKKIFDEFNRNPEKIKASKHFLNYYLDTTVKIVNKYADLKSRNLDSPELTNTLARTEITLDTVKKAFEKQLENLLKNDIMNLDVEMEVLDKTIKAEGMDE